MNFLKHYKTKKINKVLKNLQENSITTLRKKVKILMIDDEVYDIVELLNKRGYSIFYKNDVTYTIEVEPFDIVIVDIKGVGKNFGSPLQGLGYAKEVKKDYPHKIVLCYSGSTADPSFSEQLFYIDGFIKKDADIDSWVAKLDGFIKEYSDINYHWDIIKKQLKEHKFDIKKINEIEIIYRRSFENDDFDELKNTIMGIIDDAGMCLGVLNSLITLIKLFT